MTMQNTVITLGNGQLGLMLGKAAKKLGISYSMMSMPEVWAWLKDSPDPQTLVTFEQEHVDEGLLKAIRDRGIASFPTWEAFLLLKSKLSQKKFLTQHGIPTSPFVQALPWTTQPKFYESDGAILKSGKGGYDGKGVWLVEKDGQTKDGNVEELAAKLIEPYLEKKVDFDFEAAAVVCRSKTGEIELYPTVKSIQKEGICVRVEYTREFAEQTAAKKAGAVAREIAEKLQYVGVLAVECFVSGDDIKVNEIAPRVHNSGHFTIDVCAGSQFENHLRAGLGMPLAHTVPSHRAALMENLLWPASEKEFAPLFAKLTCGPAWPENAKLHWYGKTEIRPKRKMGHFTVYGNTIEECRILADQILASRWA